MRIHLYLAISVILIGLLLGLTTIEIAILCCVISFVLIAEIVNTALEVNLDFLNNKKFHPSIKMIKDIVAGVVLIASINAVIVGGIIFLPYLDFLGNTVPESIEYKRPTEQEPKEKGVVCKLGTDPIERDCPRQSSNKVVLRGLSLKKETIIGTKETASVRYTVLQFKEAVSEKRTHLKGGLTG